MVPAHKFWLQGTAATIATVILLLTGCTSQPEVYVTDVDPREWQTPATVTIPNTDTTTLRDLCVLMRTNDRFTGDTLTLRITLYTPDSLRHEERLFVVRTQSRRSAILAQEILIPYRTHVRFRHEGDYRILLTPTVPTAGIEAAGIHLEKSN